MKKYLTGRMMSPAMEAIGINHSGVMSAMIEMKPDELVSLTVVVALSAQDLAAMADAVKDGEQ